VDVCSYARSAVHDRRPTGSAPQPHQI